MGIHPGCPVCLIVAASLVAVETNVGETISETLSSQQTTTTSVNNIDLNIFHCGKGEV